MSFNISEILEKLKAIEGFANKVAETKRLADELAENLARLKIEVNKTINDSFSQIADQIETLRRNMESMESVHPGAQPAEPARAPTPTPAPKAAPAAARVEPAPRPTPAPAPSRATPTLTPTPKPAPAPTPKAATQVTAPPPTAEPMDEEVVVLLQKKDRLKASLTDLRFDYMRGYIPEPEYKSKEAELDAQLEELERDIASKK
jgi:outer membrane biosynthesis protein TonB